LTKKRIPHAYLSKIGLSQPNDYLLFQSLDSSHFYLIRRTTVDTYAIYEGPAFAGQLEKTLEEGVEHLSKTFPKPHKVDGQFSFVNASQEKVFVRAVDRSNLWVSYDHREALVHQL
jgi:hypothetical protein